MTVATKKPSPKTKAAQVPDNQLPLSLQPRRYDTTAVHDKVVVAQLSASMSWGIVTDKRISEEVEVDKQSAHGAMKVRKKLLPGDSGKKLQLVQQTLNGFKQYHYQRTWATPTEGQRLLPVAFYVEYMEEFNTAQARAEVQLAELLADYLNAVEAARLQLGHAFDPTDYPSSEELRSYFRFGVRFFPLPAGSNIFGVLGAEVARDVDGYVAEILTDATEQAKDRLRKAVARLVPYKDPKARVYDTAMQGIDEIINLLPAMNLTGDTELNNLIAEVKQKLYGWAPDDLRNDVRARTEVAKAAENILRKMGGK